MREKRKEAKKRQRAMLCLPPPEVKQMAECPVTAVPMLEDGSSTSANAEQTADAEDGTAVDVQAELEQRTGAEENEESENSFLPQRLRVKKSCYICKNRFDLVHRFYDQLCPDCAELNYQKRNQVCDLTGKVALLTGGRIKIGFEVGLKLLRFGATLIVTTRFPKDCYVRYAKEADFEEWKDRLHIYGLDLRQLAALELFIQHIKASYSRLDIVINNAAQTIRRPPSFYAHLLPTECTSVEQLPYKEDATRILTPNAEFQSEFVSSSSQRKPQRRITASITPYDDDEIEDLHKKKKSAVSEKFEEEEEEEEEKEKEKDGEKGRISESSSKSTKSTSPEAFLYGPSTSAVLSQVKLVEGDDKHDTSLFPQHLRDEYEQQVDLRTRNSWVLPLEEVPTAEMLEVQSINTIAPFIINSKLKELLTASGEKSFVINVSAMEGQFYKQFKTGHHPHTNMAKAALNMMTRTSAPMYAEENIFMNSVDTGWINDECPFPVAQQNEERGFRPPLDEIDAAMRILDPILTGLRDTDKPCQYGMFLKDYASCPW
ncbi:Oxidoreductase, variant 2 [Balamuthia mandrillaris]